MRFALRPGEGGAAEEDALRGGDSCWGSGSDGGSQDEMADGIGKSHRPFGEYFRCAGDAHFGTHLMLIMA
jgi:hypothetical protein